jgi:hypothetical protein
MTDTQLIRIADTLIKT